ncbi:MAG: serine--tRNA ligase [Verrucomicrobiota bacterium]
MIDIKILRESADAVKEAVARKKFACDVDAVVRLDAKRRELITAAESARAEQKAASKAMASLEKGSPEFMEKVGETKALAARAKTLDQEAKVADTAFQSALLTIPNVPDASIPDGRDESYAKEVLSEGDIEAYPHALPHFDIPWFSKLIDFDRGSKVTGAGFPFYIGDAARLVRALLQYFLDAANDAGFQEMAPPIFVNEASATATGQLPDKEGQMYVDQNEELYLIPTAEVPVTNFIRNEILENQMLPLKRCAYTPCFRREAGSWGAHVRGLNRLHQFDKVEVVKWTKPESSLQELESLRAHAESLLRALELPFRTLLMPAGDIGFTHSKQYDLEVFAAGQKRWLEVSSCSSFTDFQSRRANIRYRDEAGNVRFVHTLNGSALAIPRVLAAILENNLQADGSVAVPKVLQPYFKKEFIKG